MALDHLTAGASTFLYLVSAAVIALVGVRLTDVADELADRTGIGEAFMGALFLGATTSLGGITATAVAAWDGLPRLALANAMGGIAAQTAFLAIADFAHRKANLEHAAASVPNMMMGALLIVLLATILLGIVGPEVLVFGVHPVTPVLVASYIFGMRMIYRSRNAPMWRPQMTSATREDRPQQDKGRSGLAGLWIRFSAMAAIVLVAGWCITRAAEGLMETTGLSQSAAGGLLTAISTSLPELVTSVAAVRRGALTLAVGGILGGNAFDTLMVSLADGVYRDGSVYHAASSTESVLVTLTIIMSAILLLGLLRREKSGIANIGFESFLVLLIYAVAVIVLGVS